MRYKTCRFFRLEREEALLSTILQLAAHNFVASETRTSSTTVRRRLRNTGIRDNQFRVSHFNDYREPPVYVGLKNTLSSLEHADGLLYFLQRQVQVPIGERFRNQGICWSGRTRKNQFTIHERRCYKGGKNMGFRRDLITLIWAYSIEEF